MSKRKVGIVLVNYKKFEDTLSCIKSLRSLNYPNFKIFVVDNNSNNDSVNILSKECDIILLPLSENLGFGGGNNVGYINAKEQNCDYIWILNNDTIVMPDTLCKLIEFLEANAAMSAIGGKIYHTDSLEVQAVGGGRILWYLGIAPLSKKIRDDLDYLSGACILIDVSKIEDPPFDEQYFMYWEDTDFSVRLRKAGHLIGVAERAIIYHKESSSLTKFNPVLERYYAASMVKFFLNHSNRPMVSILSGTLLRLFRRIVLRKFTSLTPTFRGVIDAKKTYKYKIKW